MHPYPPGRRLPDSHNELRYRCQHNHGHLALTEFNFSSSSLKPVQLFLEEFKFLAGEQEQTRRSSTVTWDLVETIRTEKYTWTYTNDVTTEDRARHREKGAIYPQPASRSVKVRTPRQIELSQLLYDMPAETRSAKRKEDQEQPALN